MPDINDTVLLGAVTGLTTAVAALFKLLLSAKDETIAQQAETIRELTDTLRSATIVVKRQAEVAELAVRSRR